MQNMLYNTKQSIRGNPENERRDSMRIAIIALFAAASALQLIACAAGKRTLRSVTKAFLMPLLLAYYLLYAKNVLVFPALALCLAWVGDMLLLKRGKSMLLAAGAFSFAGGHVCNLIAVLLLFAPVFGPYALVTAAVLTAVILFDCIALRKELRAGFVWYTGVPAYLTVLCLFVLFAVQTLFTAVRLETVLLTCGAWLFLCSDSILFFRRFRHSRSNAYAFWVMLTYILAQGLLTAAFSLA